jgi:hypothetical protein
MSPSEEWVSKESQEGEKERQRIVGGGDKESF